MKKRSLKSTVMYLGLSLCLTGGIITYTGPATQFQYATCEDIVEGTDSIVQIEEDDVPLAAPKVTTKTTTKTTTKKQKMAKAATKDSKSSKTSIKVSTSTTSNSKEKRVKNTTVKTTVLTTTKKKSNIKTIKTTVKTTVKTTITALATHTISDDSKVFTVNKFEDIKGHIDQKVYDSFKKLEFKYIVDSKLGSTGVYSVGNHWIKLKSGNGYYLMHELGHFVSTLKDDADGTSEWNSIYKAEKSKYTGYNKNYVTKTAAEYFAESFRDYSENPAKLKKERPKTFAYMDRVIKSINVNEDSRWFYIQYGAYWDSVIYF